MKPYIRQETLMKPYTTTRQVHHCFWRLVGSSQDVTQRFSSEFEAWLRGIHWPFEEEALLQQEWTQHGNYWGAAEAGYPTSGCSRYHKARSGRWAMTGHGSLLFRYIEAFCCSTGGSGSSVQDYHLADFDMDARIKPPKTPISTVSWRFLCLLRSWLQNGH